MSAGGFIAGRVVDIVPSHGSVHLLATCAAIACIEPRCEEWTACKAERDYMQMLGYDH